MAQAPQKSAAKKTAAKKPAAKKTAGKKTVVLKQTKSAIRRVEAQAATLRGLGFRRVGHTVEVEDTPMTRGMIRAVAHMIEIVEERG